MILETINRDKFKFMKDRKMIELNTVRLILAEAKNKEIALKRPLTDTDVFSVINTLVKQITESLGYADKNKDELRYTEYLTQLEVLKSYLPKQMSADEIREIVLKAIDTVSESARNIGTVMKTVMPLVAGKADGNLVRIIVNESLK